MNLIIPKVKNSFYVALYNGLRYAIFYSGVTDELDDPIYQGEEIHQIEPIDDIVYRGKSFQTAKAIRNYLNQKR